MRAPAIDPVLNYSTYLGGTGDDYGSGIGVDAAGNIYVTGTTYNVATFLPLRRSFARNPLDTPANASRLTLRWISEASPGSAQANREGRKAEFGILFPLSFAHLRRPLDHHMGFEVRGAVEQSAPDLNGSGGVRRIEAPSEGAR